MGADQRRHVHRIGRSGTEWLRRASEIGQPEKAEVQRQRQERPAAGEQREGKTANAQHQRRLSGTKQCTIHNEVLKTANTTYNNKRRRN